MPAYGVKIIVCLSLNSIRPLDAVPSARLSLAVSRKKPRRAAYL